MIDPLSTSDERHQGVSTITQVTIACTNYIQHPTSYRSTSADCGGLSGGRKAVEHHSQVGCLSTEVKHFLWKTLTTVMQCCCNAAGPGIHAELLYCRL